MAGFKITRLYAFIAIDPEDGDEGVLGFLSPDGQWMPMIGADMERVASLKPMAEEISKATGVKYEIRYFTVTPDDGEKGLH